MSLGDSSIPKFSARASRQLHGAKRIQELVTEEVDVEVLANLIRAGKSLQLLEHGLVDFHFSFHPARNAAALYHRGQKGPTHYVLSKQHPERTTEDWSAALRNSHAPLSAARPGSRPARNHLELVEARKLAARKAADRFGTCASIGA